MRQIEVCLRIFEVAHYSEGDTRFAIRVEEGLRRYLDRYPVPGAGLVAYDIRFDHDSRSNSVFIYISHAEATYSHSTTLHWLRLLKAIENLLAGFFTGARIEFVRDGERKFSPIEYAIAMTAYLAEEGVFEDGSKFSDLLIQKNKGRKKE